MTRHTSGLNYAPWMCTCVVSSCKIIIVIYYYYLLLNPSTHVGYRVG